MHPMSLQQMHIKNHQYQLMLKRRALAWMRKGCCTWAKYSATSDYVDTTTKSIHRLRAEIRELLKVILMLRGVA
jgi:hypothetical protein